MSLSTPNEKQIQADVTSVLNGAHRDVDLSPWERIAQANQMALEAAKDPYIRQAAVEALRGCQDVPNKGGEHLAKWVRKNITYAAEAPGVEVLQGPFTTLALRTGDCDDLSITWAALARSVSIDAYVAGIAEQSDPEGLVHAVGYDQGKNTHWELSLDRRWGGPLLQPLAFTLPDGYLSVWWSPEAHRLGYWVDRGAGYEHVSTIENTENNTMPTMRRTRNPYDAKGQWYEETTSPANGATGKPSDGIGIESSGGSTWLERLLLDPLSTFAGGVASQAPGAIFNSGEGLVEPPPEDVSYMQVQPQQSSGMPTWVWGLLGLGAVGGVVWYLVKR